MEKGLYYLTIPYRGTEDQKAARLQLARQAVFGFLNRGILVFAPVIYINHIYETMGMPTLDNRREVVTNLTFEVLKASKGLILLTADGWQDSEGVRRALEHCQEHHIPVFTISPDQLKGDLSGALSDVFHEVDIDQLMQLDTDNPHSFKSTI